jgi:hypothetical protein
MRRPKIGAVYGSGEDKKEISYCEYCWTVKILSPLKQRLYFDDNGKVTRPPPDADKWRQCWTCGRIIPVYEAKQETELTSLTEPSDDPFDSSGKWQIRSVVSTRTGNYRRSKHKRKQDLSRYKEEDIKEALRKGARLISYTET